MSVAASQWTKGLEEMIRSPASLRLKLEALHADERCWERVVLNFVERVCTSYSRLLRTQARSYRNRLNALYRARNWEPIMLEGTTFTSERTLTRYELMRESVQKGEAISSPLKMIVLMTLLISLLLFPIPHHVSDNVPIFTLFVSSPFPPLVPPIISHIMLLGI